MKARSPVRFDPIRCFPRATGARTTLPVTAAPRPNGARAASEASLERRAEAAMTERLGRTFLTIIRPIDALRDLLASDPYRAFRLAPGAKRVVTFLRRRPTSRLALPIEFEGARILAVKGAEAFSAYVRHPKSPVFMTLIERTFGKEGTTRTWDTVAKVAR